LAETMTVQIKGDVVGYIRSVAASTGIDDGEVIHRGIMMYIAALRMARLHDDGLRIVHVVRPPMPGEDRVSVLQFDLS